MDCVEAPKEKAPRVAIPPYEQWPVALVVSKIWKWVSIKLDAIVGSVSPVSLLGARYLLNPTANIRA